MTNRLLFFGSQASREEGLVQFHCWRRVKLIVRDVKAKKLVTIGADYRKEIYRLSIKSLPNYKHLLQENYVEHRHIFFNIT